jgi:hypothetical protein
VRIHLESGSKKDLLLSQSEVLNLLAALSNRNYANQSFNFWYDSPDKKLSGVLILDKVEYIDVDDKDLVSLKDMELVNYKSFRIWKEPSWFYKFGLKVKWYFRDRKEKKEKETKK